MSRSHRILPVGVTFALLCFSAPTILAEETPKTQDLNDYLCRDVMILSGNDRDNALALLHGFRMGEKKTTQFVVDALAEDTDMYLDYCLDHPKDNALEAFRQITK